MKKEMILDTDPRAAELVTVQLWKSMNGLLYNEERIARYDSCTHRACQECQAPTAKHYTHCDACREKRRHERYMALPLVEWDGITPLCLHDDDTYFFSREEVDDHLDQLDEPMRLEDLDIVLCKPVRPRELDCDYFSDELPEDGELPQEIEDAVDALNKAIRESSPTCWYADSKRVCLTAQGSAK